MAKNGLQKDRSEKCKKDIKESTNEVVSLEFNGERWIKDGKTLYIKLVNK